MTSTMRGGAVRPPAPPPSVGAAGPSPRPRPARRRTLLAVLVVAVVLGSLVAVAQRQRGLQSMGNRLSSGSAWLLARNGTVTLVDGLSGREVTRLPAANSGAEQLRVVQHGPDGFVVNRSRGTIMRLDGRSLRSGAPVGFSVPGGDPLLDIHIAGDDLAWVTSGATDTVYPVDPDTLAPRGQNLALPTEATGTAVTPEGVLFVLDAPGRILDVFDPSAGARRRVLDGVGPDAELAVVDGNAVLVDPAQGARFTLGAGGAPGVEACFAVPSGTVQLGTSSPGSAWLPAIGADRRLYAAQLSRSDCPTPIALDAPGGPGRYGAPVEKDGLVYVPDFATGEVVIVDVGRPQPSVTRSGSVIPAGNEFDLFVDDGLLWVDDRAGDVAGVLLADRTVRNVRKFDPEGTGGGAVAGTVPDAVSPADVEPGTPPDDPAPRPPGPTVPPTPEPEQEQEEAPGVSIPGPDPRPDPDPGPGSGRPDPVVLQAGFEAPAGVFVDREATFVSNSTGSPSAYEWSVDGRRAGENSGLLRHTFRSLGPATVSLTVVAADGRRSSVSRTVEVEVDNEILTTVVPNVVGLGRAAAVQELTRRNLSVGEVRTQESKRPRDEVLAQNPTGGRVEEGTAVDLVVSSGGGPFALPDVRGTLCADARKLLTDAGLIVPEPTVFPLKPPASSFGDVAAIISVITTKAPGTIVSPGDTVGLDCKQAPPVPNVVGSLRAEAEATIAQRLGDTIPIKVVVVIDATRRQNEVVAQLPAAGTPANTDTLEVTLSLASGPATEEVTVPAVCNGTTAQADAERALQTAGLAVGNVGGAHDDTVADGAVIRTAPACGAKVAKGSIVDLVVSTGPAPFSLADYRGSDEATISADLQRLGLRFARAEDVFHPTYAIGRAASTNPGPGATVVRGQTVTVAFSKGPAPVPTVPKPTASLSCAVNGDALLPCSVAVADGIATRFDWSIGIEVLVPPGNRTATTTTTVGSINISGYGKYGASPPDTTGTTIVQLQEQIPNPATLTVTVTFQDGQTATASARIDWFHCH